MIETRLQDKLKSGLEVENFQQDGAIYLSLNPCITVWLAGTI